MPTQSTSVMYPATIDELGKSFASVDVVIKCIVHPGEDMVMYYPDGSGYPGSPPEVEIIAVHVTDFTTPDIYVSRVDKPDWFELLDRIILAHVETYQESFDPDILEYTAEWVE